ncbi:11938_t:CDS:10 [Diversispora eburnea]|uniref:11938_t:CDS:1 n=1 Tax=Diversispora eburnea TaxID=1213867 RepID=A0A9N9BFZ0_9GLOM|nr:11938_t:CDS:10 [Diversispora eburnea]
MRYDKNKIHDINTVFEEFPSSNGYSINSMFLRRVFGLGSSSSDGEIFNVTFHVHLPNFDRTGEPVVIGSDDKLGNWQKLNKLEQPDPHSHPTYWRSNPINIFLLRENMSEIKYKYGISFKGHVDYEGEGERFEQTRTLDTTISDQYDIWLNNKKYFMNIDDFAFVDVIYQSTDASNYKEKIMQYQSLLKNHGHHARDVANIEFIISKICPSQAREKRLFLCVLLGYHIKHHHIIQLPQHFQSVDLLETLENVSDETLPSSTLELMPRVLQSLVQHNAASKSFVWIGIFKSARILDPQFSFVDSFIGVEYNNEELVNFFKIWNKSAKTYMKYIGEEAYTKIARHLINISRTMSLLTATWKDITDRSINVSNRVRQFLIERTRINIDNSDASAFTLINDYDKIPPDFRNEVSGIFCDRVIYLLKHPRTEWNINNNLNSIEILLLSESMYWTPDSYLNALEAISQSKEIKILNIFLKLLKHWFAINNSLHDSKNPKILTICRDWFNSVLARLNESHNSSANGLFIFSVFNYLSEAYKVVKGRERIYEELSRIATTRVRECSEQRILKATTRVVNLDVNVVREFINIAADLLKHSVYNADAQLLDKIQFICGNTKTDGLKINFDIVTNLQSHYIPPSTPEHHLKLLNSGQFWEVIFRAEGHVENLHKHPHVQQIRDDINQLAVLIAEKTIDIKSLLLLLKHNDIELFTYLDCPNSKAVFISKQDISEARKHCKNYESTLNELRIYYETFCSTLKVSDAHDYLSKIDTESRMLSRLRLKDILNPDHWEFHSETIEMARKVSGFAKSKTFANIFNLLLSEVTETLTVEDITKTILTKALERFAQLCQQYKDQDWEKLKCSDAVFLWKGVTNVEFELRLMGNYVALSKNQKQYDHLVRTLKRLVSIPDWVVRPKQLFTIIEIFDVPHEKDDWFTKSRCTLQDDIITLGNLSNFFDYLNENLTKIDSDTCWLLIKELSAAGNFLEFLKSISEHDIRNLINGVEDFNNERLNQEDTVASLIQVQQLLLQLMNKVKSRDISIKKFLADLATINADNPTLVGKIILSSSCNMALQNIYKNISNRGEVTKERIQNAVKGGTYSFERVGKDEKFTVKLIYPSKESNVKPYSLSDLQYLRGRAMLIAKPTSAVNLSMDANEEQIMDKFVEFVREVDLVHEIYNVGVKLIQMGNFGYRKYKKSVSGGNKMKELTELLKSLKEDLNRWEKIVDKAQEIHYYLTFFPAHHILTFLDYFTNDDPANGEICKTLIRFVNEKARLMPIKKDVFKISQQNYFEILCEIGAKIKNIFSDIPIQLRPIKTKGVVVPSDIVHRGRLFVAACNDKLLIPNIIMSIYTNHGYFPEPWQILICKSFTTMEELSIFIKRCFLAADNGYKDHLFCIANLEILEFDLQYNLVNHIRSLRENHDDYLLALICCREAGLHYHILDQFLSEVVNTYGLCSETMKAIYSELCPNVSCVFSDLSGQGKSEWIKQSSFLKHKIPRSFLISDGINFSKLVHQLKKFQFHELHEGESLHINIVSANNSSDVNMFLFELLTLGFVFNDMEIVYLPKTTIFIEIASTDEQKLLYSLPITSYFDKTHIFWDINSLIVSNEIHSPIQIVSYYLNALDQATIDENNIHFSGEGAITQPLPAKRCQELVAKYFFDENTDNISSFRFVEIFINVLADQLVRFSSSSYIRVENLKQIVKDEDLRTTLLRKLIDVSKDFATRSVQTKVTQSESIGNIDADFEDIKIDIKSWDDSNHLLVCFMSQSPDSICTLYRDPKKVDENVKSFLRSHFPGNLRDWKLEDYNSLPDRELLITLECLARKTTKKINLPYYALSADNLVKMALILLRARANIPVVVMGEAGCGKTSLISYLAGVVEVKFIALNLHAGISEAQILDFMSKVENEAVNGEIWIFFDEINTCDHIGLLADLIAHQMLLGNAIHPNIRLFSACNPYRIRTIQAGLKAKVNSYEELSKLVYQVKPLPGQILDYVWDYGILQKNDEKRYIQIMTHEELKDCELNHPVLTELLFGSQEFIRSIEESYSVSLRDVKRVIKLIRFFNYSLSNRPRRTKEIIYPDNSIELRFRCYILALALCYESRIYDREERVNYRKDMIEIFRSKGVNLDHHKFREIIKQEQDDIVKRMNMPPNTALNEALLENVLVMIVCILTRIPAFIIGAPGSSKSLAIRLISQNLRGKYSNDQYFQTLPQVYLIPHQGSSSSTSDDIIKVFQKAVKYQNTSTDEFPSISVVLLDQVGLAETSPHNPLKILHSLLEPSYPADGPTVSVVGISNRRLDDSKSSRVLLVQRPKFGIEDLVETADQLLEGNARSMSLKLLAEAYSEYEQSGQILHPNFHGLRDYYGLVKSLSMTDMTPDNIQMALARNFGGTDQNARFCEEYFGNVLQKFNNYGEWKYEPISTSELINANLRDKSARHLMVIGKSDSIVNILDFQLKNQGLEPMMCVEAGRPLILTDLDIIYGALYDLWDQNYIVYGNKENPRHFIRVSLGTYANPMLYVVDNKFRCILVLDESKLDKADPLLLNRFEKQRLTFEDALTKHQFDIVEILEEWVRQMGTLVSKNGITSLSDFTLKDLFIGFDPDETLQSLVMYIMKMNPESQHEEILRKCKESLVAIASADGIIRATKSGIDLEESLFWKNVYFPPLKHKNQHHDDLFWNNVFFPSQEGCNQFHYHLEDYFIALFCEGDSKPLLVIINTFSNINTDVKECLEKVMQVQVYKLSTFKTESQLHNRVKHFWFESDDQMLVIQCDVAAKNSGCIKLAKFIIEQYRNEFLQIKTQKMRAKHACIILHIHREQETQFLSFNFMCGWRQVTIETLVPQEKHLSALLDGSLINIMESIYPFEEILKQELLWCLLCIKYPSTENSINHIKIISSEIFKHPNFVECLKEKTFILINKKSSPTDWQYHVASNKQLLYPYSSFSAALQAYIHSFVRNPIAKMLYSLEKLSAIKTFFDIDQPENRIESLKLWKDMFDDPIVMATDDLVDPDPGIYTLPQIYDLRFPFSYYFMKRIDDFKEEYLEEIAKLKQDKDNCDKFGELQPFVEDKTYHIFKSNIFSSILHLRDALLEEFSELYFNDFVTVVSSILGEKKDVKLLSLILQQLLDEEKINDPVYLHVYWWTNSSTILADFQLAQLCPTIINDLPEERANNTFEDFPIQEVTTIMLNKLSEINVHQMNQWQKQSTKFITYAGKQMQSQKFSSFELLRICNELVSKSISLSDIKKIAKLGQTSDGLKIFSEK